jgi:pimeloyl-ACP methyl ester carboxylesterase
MVVAVNAYWLNFFLKRDINVICWNYRGYGASTISFFDYLTPTKAKQDAEKVLARSLEILKLQGKIGVYGRSIGGITACHLAGKYNDLVEILIIDRSLNELQDWVATKAKGKITITLY